MSNHQELMAKAQEQFAEGKKCLKKVYLQQISKSPARSRHHYLENGGSCHQYPDTAKTPNGNHL